MITEVDGTTVQGPDAVGGAVADRAPGDKIEVTIRRGGGSQTVTVALGTRPEATR